MTIHFHKNDLPKDVMFNGDLAIDTETMGLNNLRDRLCVIQLSDGNGDAHLVNFDKDNYKAPNLKKLLRDKNIQKIFHFARFDVAVIKHYLGVDLENIYCTKIASRLSRTYTDGHSLKDLCNELVRVKISKQQQSSDWGNEELKKEQQEYAASDVLYLHAIREKLNMMLKREGRLDLANKCFAFILTRAALDLAGWPEFDIFAH